MLVFGDGLGVVTLPWSQWHKRNELAQVPSTLYNNKKRSTEGKEGEENYSWCKGYQSNVDNGQGSENLFISSVAMTK